ncbi:hypothetical protein ACQEVC_03065 [Plantactinospora sp. CA-294935]|uniref:hypothetical protein n=1 Tax=Plantactinospora sp. CA-294935 TaxID=3240012 RepID=UPI003D8FA7C4
MQDQLVLAVATALAAKGGEALIVGGGSALGRLYRLLRDRFRHNGTDVAVPDDAIVDRYLVDRAVLAEKLGQLMAADPDLRAEVESLWRAAGPELAADSGGVVNQFSGTATRVVQARDIRGNVSF